MDELERAVREEVGSWGPPLSTSALAAAVIDIAVRLGEEDLKPSGAALLHTQLRGYLADLRKLAPDEETSDDIDEVTAQRDKRRRDAGIA